MANLMSKGAGGIESSMSRSIEGSSSRGGDSSHGSPAPTPLLCGCRRPAAIYTSNTTANPRREFYKCANPARQARCTCFKDNQGCFLWIWKDCLNKFCADEWVRKRDSQSEEIRMLKDEGLARERRMEDKLDDTLFELADAADEIDRLKLQDVRQQYKIKEQAAIIKIIVCVVAAAIVYSTMFLA